MPIDREGRHRRRPASQETCRPDRSRKPTPGGVHRSRVVSSFVESLSHAFCSPSRPLACPSLSRIVSARDGGLCRIKLPGGELSALQALAIADAVDDHASGIIELTNRANLQLRGVRTGHELALTEQLVAAGLGPKVARQTPVQGGHAHSKSNDAAVSAGHTADRPLFAAADDVRNLLVNPTAGRDADAWYDTRPRAAQLLALLEGEPRFAALSPKFALLLDGGERLAVLDHSHDIWLCAMRPSDGDVWFAFGLDGHPSTQRRCALAAVRHDNVLAFVRALLDTFLELAGPQDKRMRDVLATQTPEALVQRASERIDFPLRRDADIAAWRRTAADAALRFGAHPQREAGLWYVGAQPSLGRIDATALRALARLASEHGDATLRITPWQSILLPDIAERAVSEVEAGLDALGFLRDASHPLARMIACAGSAGCTKSHADTKADALSLAALLPANVDVHLTGCIRSCAAAHCASYTLLATAHGRYDVYQRAVLQSDVSRKNQNHHDCASRFGRLLAADVPIDAAAALLDLDAASRSRAPYA